MRHKKLKAAAVVLAISSMAGEAWAETVCAGAQDLTALQVASVQQRLMVAALACEADNISLYNSFVTIYQPELVASDEALQAYFIRRTPATGTDDYHAFKTKLANSFSVRSAQNRAAFCAKSEGLFHEALAGRKKSLAAFALSQPMVIDADYTVCGQSIKGESYAYAAVKEEPQAEKPVIAQPAIVALPPPGQTAPETPAVISARDEPNTRAVAENLAPAMPTYRLQPQAAPQSSCSRMSNGYLDCYYGDFHYYRDPYGRYLPPPPSYRRSY
jgi:hypothetical protein